MHSRMFHARARCCGGRACDVPAHPHHHFTPGEEAGGFGVRRPLRFLAWRLELDERQVGELARVLNELKTERAQAAVDDRRALTLLADAAAGDTFDDAMASEAVALRVNSAERVQAVVKRSLGRIHALLQPEQRERFAYLIRTGTLML